MGIQKAAVLLLSLTVAVVSSSDVGVGSTDDSAAASPADDEIACEYAYHRCLNRDGCKTVLGYYLDACDEVQVGQTNECSVSCRRALVGLMSTEEGKLFLQCRCSDDRCATMKERMSVCRPGVEAVLRNPAGLTCLDAEMVCEADAACANALQFYKTKCRKLFDGVKCSRHCQNSVLILQRQEKALPLKHCRCDGTEAYDCLGIRHNLQRLCFLPPATAEKPATTKSKPSPDSADDVEGGGGGSPLDEDANDVDYGDDYNAVKKVPFPYSVSGSDWGSGRGHEHQWRLVVAVSVAAVSRFLVA